MGANPGKPLDIPLNRGIRQDLEATQMPPGTLLEANNVEFDRYGRIQRRGGFVSVPKGTKLSKTNVYGSSVTRRVAEGASGEQLFFTDTTAFVNFPGRSGVSEAGFDNSFLTQRATLIGRTNIGLDQANTVYFADCASVTNGSYVYLVVAYTQYSYENAAYGVHVDVIDKTTGARLLSGIYIGATNTTVQPRVVVCNTVAFVIYASSIAKNISYGKIDLTGPTFSAPTTGTLIIDSDGANQHFDVAPTHPTAFVVAYRFDNGAGAISAKVARFNSGPTIIGSAYAWTNSSNAAWTSGAFGVRGATGTSDRIVAAGNDQGNSNMEIVSLAYDLSDPQKLPQTMSGETIKQVCVARVDSTHSLIAWSGNNSLASSADAAQPRGHIYWGTLTENGVGIAPTMRHTSTGTSGRTIFANYVIGSKFFTDSVSGNVFSMARFNDPSGFQSHFLLLDWNSGANVRTPMPVAHVASGTVPLGSNGTSGATTGYCGIGGLTGTDAYGGFTFVAPVNIGTSSLSGQQVGVWDWRASSHLNYLSTQAQGALICGGGTPLAYDGQRLVEESFYCYPSVGTTSYATATTTGTMAAGIYQYSFVYEWVDAKGNRHQSPPCPQITVDMSGSGTSTNKVTWTLPTLHATRKQSYPLVPGTASAKEIRSQIRIIMYRSKVGDTTMHRHSTSAVVDVLNETTITLVDTLSDATTTPALGLNEILYTQQGKLPTFAPPPTIQPIVHGRRVWGADAEFPETIWCTKTLEDGEAPSYSPALRITVPGAQKIRGLAAQDGKLYALTQGGTWLASYGDGPTNTGQGSFPEPQLINQAINCNDARSIVMGADGIFFAGDARWGTTIYMIRRGEGTPIDIGKRVRTLLVSCPVVRGALDNWSKGRAEFLCVDNDDNPQAVALLYYHYDLIDEEGIGQWSSATPTIGECIGAWDGATVFGGYAGSLGIQTDGGADFGDGFQAKITTGDIRPFGLVGYGQVDALTVSLSPAASGNINLEASYNGGYSYPDTATLTDANVQSAGGSGYPTTIRWEPPTKKLQYGAVRYRFTDDLTATTGPTWLGLSIEGLPLGGNSRPTAAQRS